MVSRSFSLIIITVLVFGCRTTRVEQQYGFINVFGSKIFYTKSGEGEKVFLAHAGFQDHRMWDKQVDALTKQGFQVVTIDLPGHGASVSGDSVYLVQDYIKAILDSLKISKTSLVGLSLGGTTVTDFALAYPDRVDKMVLAGSLATGYELQHPVDTMVKQYIAELVPAINKKDFPEAAEVFTRYWADGIRSKTEIDSYVRNYVYNTTLKSMQEHGYHQWAKFSPSPGLFRLKELKIPVLIIYGDKDLVTIQQAATVLRDSIKGSTVKMIPNVAHMVNMEAPDEFNKAIIEFLKKD